MSLELLKALTADLPRETSKEEYRRIPWIWRVTVAAGKRNQVEEMAPIVLFCIPAEKQPLRDWQAVVLGGGIINGIGLVGGWPDEQIREIIGRGREQRKRWRQVLNLAGKMADDEKVFKGTPTTPCESSASIPGTTAVRCCRYLLKGTDDELQQGAIGGLGTMRSPSVAAGNPFRLRPLQRGEWGFALDALLSGFRSNDCPARRDRSGRGQEGQLGAAGSKSSCSPPMNQLATGPRNCCHPKASKTAGVGSLWRIPQTRQTGMSGPPFWGKRPRSWWGRHFCLPLSSRGCCLNKSALAQNGIWGKKPFPDVRSTVDCRRISVPPV